jgi:GNAT superfamily N-acetyltransferase
MENDKLKKSSLPAFDSQFSIFNSQFIPASSLPVADLANLYTGAFDDYFYPVTVTAEELARRVANEQLLLDHSPLLCVAGAPVGLALLGLRGAHSCCGGFGIVPAQRGRGLALPLTLALLDQARQRGARRMRLIVLAQNERAIATYRRAGFAIWREVWCFEWTRDRTASLASPGALVPTDVTDLLELGRAWQPIEPIWSRAPETLRAFDDLVGLALVEHGAPTAYLVLRPAPDSAADIQAIGARSADEAAMTLAALQRQYTRITCLNEPAGSPGVAAMEMLGFTRAFRRYEMVAAL